MAVLGEPHIPLLRQAEIVSLKETLGIEQQKAEQLTTEHREHEKAYMNYMNTLDTYKKHNEVLAKNLQILKRQHAQDMQQKRTETNKLYHSINQFSETVVGASHIL